MSNPTTELEAMTNDQFYWMARLLTSDEDDHMEASEELTPELKKKAWERGLSAAGLWLQLKREAREFFEERGEDLPKDWWRPQ